jgi:hypothetical protein
MLSEKGSSSKLNSGGSAELPKIEPFFRDCSSRNCTEVRAEVYKTYDKKAHKKPAKRRKGGLEVKVLEPAHIPISGEKGEYVARGHGVGIQFRRCYEFDYVDKFTHKQATQTCADTHVVNVPQRTVNCLADVSELLHSLRKGKRGRPTISHKILAAVACNKSGMPPTRVAEPLSPSSIAALTGEPLQKVRKSMEQLIKSGKIRCSGEWLPVLEEKQCVLPKPYQKAFDDFIKGEKEERKWEGFRRVFGREFIAATTSELPEADPSEYSVLPKGFKLDEKMGERAKESFMREAREWKARTGLSARLIRAR